MMVGVGVMVVGVEGWGVVVHGCCGGGGGSGWWCDGGYGVVVVVVMVVGVVMMVMMVMMVVGVGGDGWGCGSCCDDSVGVDWGCCMLSECVHNYTYFLAVFCLLALMQVHEPDELLIISVSWKLGK